MNVKHFNTTSICIPDENYMVDLSGRILEIRKLIDAHKYFTINRARQYGKTTTLNELRKSLESDFYVVALDFESYGAASFKDEDSFCRDFSADFCSALREDIRDTDNLMAKIRQLEAYSGDRSIDVRLFPIFRFLHEICALAGKPLVLIIDEVDSAADNQVFIDFLAQLRAHYQKHRKNRQYKTFQSVILAGVTDIKHIRGKISADDEEKENSPWNIAADFSIDMSFSAEEIRTMLDSYDSDHHIGMDTCDIAGLIHAYSGGYPFLVSRICQLIDEQMVPDIFDSLQEAWTASGIDEAVKKILIENNTLFDSLIGKLINYPVLKEQLSGILLRGDSIEYQPDNEAQSQLQMYGFIRNDHNTIAVSNRIFEMRLYKYFISESRYLQSMREDALEHKPAFIKDGSLNIPLIMERFIETQKTIRDINNTEAEKRFMEEEGREKFLTYLSPIINGTGTYSIEEQTRNRRRMDVVIHFLGKRYVIELKIWRGERYKEDGERQISEYMDYFGLSTGYMLSFSFNKKKKTGVEQVRFGNKILYEGIV